jgi:type IV pilus assembly protein PilA
MEVSQEVNKLTKKFLNSFRAGESGFTLIELLIVIAILGILAAVIIPNVSSFVAKSHVTAANAELSEIETAGEAAAGNATGGALAAAETVSPTTYATSDLGAYISGKVLGTYLIETDGHVYGTVTGETTSANLPSYPNATFSTATDQFVAP